MRYVITGAPCTGKSTLLKFFQAKNFNVFPEAARKIIKQELAKDSQKVPWINNLGFSELVINQQISDYNKAKTGVNFYDRAIPDVIAYFQYYEQLDLIKQFHPFAEQHNYHQKIFLLPPWEKIYAADSERKESYQEALSIHQNLIKVYESLNYKITLLPFGSIEERAKFILSHL